MGNQAVPYPLPHVGGTTSLPYPPCPELIPGIPYPISSGFGNSPVVTNNNPSAAVSQRAPYLLPPQPARVTVNNPRPLLSMSTRDLGQQTYPRGPGFDGQGHGLFNFGDSSSHRGNVRRNNGQNADSKRGQFY